MSRNNRKPEIPGASKALDMLKMEVAQELGIPDYDKIDKGDLPARVHGKVGGNMVRKMIEYAQASMKNDGQQIANVASQEGPNQQDVETVQGYAQKNTTDLQ